MKVKIKKLVPEAIIPSYSHIGDAGVDLVATSIDKTNSYIEYGTGLAVEIPKGYVGLVFPRSSISKYNLQLCNSVGVVDSCYRGEIKFRFKYVNQELQHDEYNVGDRVGQLIIIPYPEVTFEEVEDLNKTDRGGDGFGSSGN